MSAYASPMRMVTMTSRQSIEGQRLFVIFIAPKNKASYGAALDRSRDSIDIDVIIVFTSLLAQLPTSAGSPRTLKETIQKSLRGLRRNGLLGERLA